MRSFHKFLVAVLLLSGVLGGMRAYGQGGATGAISGVVADTGGGSVAGADVQIIDTRTEAVARRLTTGSDGSFVAPLLPPGTYYVVVNKSGFSEAKATGIEVHLTETTRITITLKPGTVSEKVEISAQVTSVETTNATTGQSIDSVTIRDLPLATQNYQQLLSLSAGTQSELNASAQLGRGNVRIIVNGQREDNNNYLIEGISATDYNVAQSTNVPLPNPDVIQEFKVQTSLYDASQGRNGGGNVNAILKSGTREFHGDAYEFFRNDALNANEFFLNAAGEKRPAVKQNIFGGSLGGPVVNEKFGFFFVNYQGTRQRSALSPGTQINNPAFPILPADRSAANLASIFSTPASGSCPAAPIAIDPVMQALLNFKSNQFGGDPNGFLIPSLPGTPGVTVDPTTCAVSLNSAPLIVNKPGKYTDDQFTTNWDREFAGGRDKISARFFFSDAESVLPFGAGGLQASLGGTLASSISSTDLNFPYDLPVAARFLTFNETHLFSPTLVNDFRFGYVRINNSLLNVPPVTATDLGINRPTNNVTSSIYKFTFGSSGFQIGPTPPADQFQTQNNYNFVDTVSWVKGAHVLRFGGDYTRVNLDKLFPQVFNGQVFFVNTAGVSGVSGGLTDFQKALAGQVDFSFGGGGVFDHQYRTNDFSFFGQDDWKARRNLTLHLGFQAPFLPVAFAGEPAGSLANFFLTPPNALPKGGVLDPNFVPCLGAFAGFIDPATGLPTNNTSLAANYACASGSPGLVPSQFLFGLTVPRNFVAPNTQQWNLILQRALGQQWVLEVGYIGAHAVHLRETRTSIQARLASPTNPITLTDASGNPFLITTSTMTNGPARSNNAGINGYNGFQLFADDAYSHYNSLQATLSRRWGQGYFQGAYTFSKSTDATSSGNTAFNTAFNDESNLNGSRGLSDFDRPHRLV